LALFDDSQATSGADTRTPMHRRRRFLVMSMLRKPWTPARDARAIVSIVV
jgi:hypothetical protein